MANNFVRYEDLITIEEYDEKTDKEEFVLLPLEDDLVIGRYQERRNMLEYGHQIAVRKTVYEKLINVAKDLKKINANYKVIVVYGFRDMKKQERYFNEILEEVKENFQDEMEMYEYIHEKIAVPLVSGHPTGGAVDAAEAISINDKRIVNMSEIVAVGDSILVNTERVTSPYVVKAIGDQTYLFSALSLKNSGFIDTHTSNGETVELVQQNNITIPAYRSSRELMSLNYAKEVEEE